MPVINSKITRTDLIADNISKSLKRRGQKVDKERIRRLIKKLFDKR